MLLDEYVGINANSTRMRGLNTVQVLDRIAYEFILIEWSDCGDGERIEW